MKEPNDSKRKPSSPNSSSNSTPKIKKLKLNVDDPWIAPPASVKGYCQDLLHVLSSYRKDDRQLSLAFMDLPPRQHYPDYYRVIKHPIALKKIKTKTYTDVESFKKDVLLMFDNCKTYNQPQSQIYLDCLDLQQVFLAAYQKGKKTGEVVPLSELNLMDAIERGDVGLMGKLLERGDDPNTLFETNEFNANFTWGALHVACYQGGVEMIELLMAKGADVEKEDTWYHGRPLAWAAFGGHEKICKLLMDKYHADKNAKNVDGQVARDLVADIQHPRWKHVFDEPMTFKIPASVIDTNSGSSQKYIQRTPQVKNLVGHVNPKLVKRPDLRRTPMPVQETPFAQFVSQPRDPGQDAELIEGMTLYNEDFYMDLSLEPEQGYMGYAVCVPMTIKAINLQIRLNKEYKKSSAGGFNNATVYMPGPMPGVVVSQPKIEPLTFTGQGQSFNLGSEMECGINLTEHLNSIEVVVGCMEAGREMHQSCGIFITRF